MKQSNTKFKDILCSYLFEDPRVTGKPLARETVFNDEHYEVAILVLPGTSGAHQQHLVAVMVTFKDEALRILGKLTSVTIKGDCAKFIHDTFIPKLVKSGTNPLHLIRDVKRWSNIPFTPTDRAVLLKAGVDTGIR